MQIPTCIHTCNWLQQCTLYYHVPFSHLMTNSWSWIRLLKLSSHVTSTVVAVVFW